LSTFPEKEQKPLEVELKGRVHVALRKLPIATREFSAAHEGQDEWEMARPVPQTIERYTRPIAGTSAHRRN
jgi:hypothetical protein